MNIFIDTEDMEERYGEQLYQDYLVEQNKDLKQRIDKAIEYIENHKRQDEFLQLNEWGTRDLLEILKGDNNGN